MSIYAAYHEIPSLSAEELARWGTVGYVVPRWRLPTALLSQLQDALARLLDDHAFERPDFVLQPQVPRPLDEAIDLAREFLDYLTHPDLLAIVSALAGPDVVLGGAVVRCGWPAVAAATPWYQSGAGWPVDPSQLLTVCLALDDLTPPDAGVWVRPGSHLQGDCAQQTVPGSWPTCVLQAQDPSSTEVPVLALALEAGQVALLDGQLVHYLASGVHAPRSAALLIHYFPAPAAFDRQAHRGDQHFAEHPLWLACGVDRLGQHDFDRGHTLW